MQHQGHGTGVGGQGPRAQRATGCRQIRPLALDIENMNDRPYLKRHVGPEITSAMTAIACEVKRQTGVPVGVQAGYAAALSKIVRRYVAVPLVVGVDLFNEPSAGKCPGLDVAPYRARVKSMILSWLTKHS